MAPFSRFIENVAGALREAEASSVCVSDVVDSVATFLRELVSEPGWLAPEHRRPVPGKPYSQYPLHVAADGAWSVVAFVWPAGSTTPVHDHGCWGVVGVYAGEETETTYRIRSGSRESGPVTLEEVATGVMSPGDVSTILPPHDVHAVSNHGGRTAISIHVYGADIGTHPRHTFDPESGAVRRFVSGYDDPVAVADESRTTSRNASP